MIHKKITLKYYFSVEGECEKWYLDWLAKAINTSKDARCKVRLDVKVERNPKKRVKQVSAIGKTEILHVFDFEELQQEEDFQSTLMHMREAENIGKRVNYILGYSNFTFDLWILLHKKEMIASKNHRREYLQDINVAYKTNFESLSTYKEEKNFMMLLQSLNLQDVCNAILNGEKIMQEKVLIGNSSVHFKKYEYYKENPSLNIHEYIKKIFIDVGLFL